VRRDIDVRSRQQFQQRGLARSVGTEDADDRARVDVERNAVDHERGRRPAARVIGELEINRVQEHDDGLQTGPHVQDRTAT
jgi:hypothetical protein